MSVPAPSSRHARGFALIVTIVLVAFLVLILVGLATFTRVETQVAANSQQIAGARQNALMALNVALGELQRSAGPDQRVSAPSNVGPSSASIGRSDEQPFLTGVWKHDPGAASDLPTRMYSPKLVSWLVSGNENMAEDAPTVKPTDVAALPLPSADPDVVWLLGEDSVELESTTDPISATNPEKRIRLRRTPIKAAAGTVPGADPTDTPTIGHYAWWVGDEGVKARGNLIDPFAGAPAGSDEALLRLASAQRTALERIANLDTVPANDPVLKKVLSEKQLRFADSTLADEDVRKRFHDFTTVSRGVLSDTRSGGLRRDLSHLLALPAGAGFTNALNQAFADISSDPYPADADGAHGLAEPGWSVPAGLTAWTGAAPTWEQLRSFYRLSDDVDASGKITPRPQTANAHGVFPIVLRAQLFFGLRREPGPGADENRLHLHIAPLVVLANPYDAILRDRKYTVRFQFSANAIRYESRPPSPATAKIESYGQLESFLSGARYEIQSGDLLPGEARVYILANSGSSGSGWEAATQSYSYSTSGTYQLVNDFAELDDVASLRRTLTGVSDLYAQHAELKAGTSSIGVTLWDESPAGYETILQHSDLASGSGIDGPEMGPTSTSPEIKWVGGFFWHLTDHAANNGIYGHVNYVTGVNLRAPFRANQISGPSAVRLPVYGNGAASRTDVMWYDLRLETDPSFKKVKWGFNQRSNSATVFETVENTILFAVPRSSVSSLAALQHFNPGGFFSSNTATASGAPVSFSATSRYDYSAGPSSARAFAYNPAYAIGHSRASALIARDAISKSHYRDASYLLNLALWDRFFFSSYPQAGAFDFNDETQHLANDRMRPFRDGQDFADPANFRTDATSAAANLLATGAFNVNSTSVEAWRALLSALRGADFNGEADLDHSPFPRTLNLPGESTNADDSVSTDAWSGFRRLTDAQIDILAQKIVEQVFYRGPFLNLADFVNRRVITSGSDSNGIGIQGAVAAAIEAAGLNPLSGNANLDRAPSGTRNNIEDAAHNPPTIISGGPGWISQADILQPLAPYLTARSDTFRIRAYGDVQNPATGDVESRAWVEAIVQRVPDFVGGEAASTSLLDPALSAESRAFGRRFQVISFRWLGPDDI